MKSKLRELGSLELRSINGGDGEYYKRYYFDWEKMEWRMKIIWKEDWEK